MQWKSKDFIDQPLHTLAGFLLALTTSVFTGSGLVGFLVAQTACIIRESRQHDKVTFYNLDSLFWLLGSILGTFTFLLLPLATILLL